MSAAIPIKDKVGIAKMREACAAAATVLAWAAAVCISPEAASPRRD
jgi:hypothetical protein